VGLLTAMVILALTFGSLVAMGLPILTAAVGLVTALGIIGLLTHVFTVPTVGPTLAIMIGLGVGIDYSLFTVNKYRENLARGVEHRESIARAVATAGSAIVFAGTTVIIALVSLVVAGIPLVSALGYVTAIAVLMAVLVLLAASGGHLAPGDARLRRQAARRSPPEGGAHGTGLWSRWAGVVTRHHGAWAWPRSRSRCP
jgi:uncharacterized membrane protein YdfJ with MMPL/SSD domain